MNDIKNSNENVLTAEGLAKLEARLDNLKTVKRQEIAERIKQALAFGDISENSEYDEAKNEQAFIEGEIARIENQLRTVRIIDGGKISTTEVHVGNKVTILDLETDEKMTFSIVGSAEADPLNGSISNLSPVGNAILGRKKGDEVNVSTPRGVLKYKIISIAK